MALGAPWRVLGEQSFFFCLISDCFSLWKIDFDRKGVTGREYPVFKGMPPKIRDDVVEVGSSK